MFAVKFENGKFSNLIEIETTSDEANRLVSDRHQIIEYSDPSLQMKPKDIFFVSHEKNRYTLYDFTSTELKTTVIKHVFPSELPSENLRGITHVSKTHYLLRVVTVDARCPQDRPDCDSQSQVSYAVNKADGKVSRYDYYVGKLLAADKYTIEKAGKKADEQGVFVVTVDEAFQIKKQSAKMGSYFHYNAGPYAHLWAGEGYSGELLRIKTDGSFELITKTSAAMYPSFLSGDVALMNLSSGGGIYDLSAKKLIFSTPWIEKGDGYLTDKSAFFYAGEATQAALYRISDKSDVPLVTGLSAFLGQRQSCARFFNMRIGAYTEFDRVAHSEYGGRDCNGDRNFSDGVLFYMTGGRAYYIPSTLTGITIHGFFERNLIHTPKIY